MFHLNIIWSKLLVAAVACLFTSVAYANTRLIPMVVPFSAGGPTDQIWRATEVAVNHKLHSHGIKLVTEYRPGAGGLIAANHVAQANTTTLGIFSTALVIAPVINPGVVTFKPADLTLVSYFGRVSMVAVSTKHQSLQSLKQACDQGLVNYGSSGVGSATHLFGHLVSNKIGCKSAVHIPYKGMATASPDLQSGRLDYLVDFATSATAPKLDIDLDQLPIENWHVFVANSAADPSDLAALQQAFDSVKKNSVVVDKIQQQTRITHLADRKSNQWFLEQFGLVQKLVSMLNVQ